MIRGATAVSPLSQGEERNQIFRNREEISLEKKAREGRKKEKKVKEEKKRKTVYFSSLELQGRELSEFSSLY